MPDELFTPDVVAAVTAHMNNDHPEDNVLICQALGGRPDTTAARMSEMDSTGIAFAATTPDGLQDVRVPWQAVPTERRAIRTEVVRMYREACTALGIEPREEEPAAGRPSH